VDAGHTPTVMLATASGRPRERVVTVDGREIHRCRANPD